MFRSVPILLICLLLINVYSNICPAQTAQEKSELSKAVRESVRLIESRIVNIQIWGAKQTKADFQAANHLTGFVVSEDDSDNCFIVTTLFGFDPVPSAILITNAQGNRQTGKIVARDFLHKLVLLKTIPATAGEPATKPDDQNKPDRTDISDISDSQKKSQGPDDLNNQNNKINQNKQEKLVNVTKPLQPGQWVIACGRVFPAWLASEDGQKPGSEIANQFAKFNVNVSIGILSATGRIGGLAIQTDAAVSPNNYGGPLLDLEGRVLGILTPLSPEDESAMAGFEWYDSGIGFAIPIETVERLLPRWKQGQDMHPGWAGFGVETKNPAISEPISAGPPADSPAQKAGLTQGDRIVALDGQNIATMAQGIRILNRKFAGEEISVVVERKTKADNKSDDKARKETLTLKMTLERRPEKPKPSIRKTTSPKMAPESPKKPELPEQQKNGSQNDA